MSSDIRVMRPAAKSNEDGEHREKSILLSPVVIAAAGFVVFAVVTFFTTNSKGVSSDDLVTEANLLRGAICAFALLAVLFAYLDRTSAMLTIRALKERVRDAKERTRQVHAEMAALMSTLDAVSEGVIHADPKGNVRFLNAAAGRMVGIANAEAIGHPLDRIARLFHCETNEKLPLPTVKALKEIAPVRASHSVLMTVGGIATHVDAGAAPLWADEKLAGVVLILSDVSHRLHVEEELRTRLVKAEGTLNANTESKEDLARRVAERLEQAERAAKARADAAIQVSAERLESLLRASIDALIIADERGIITEASPSATQLLAGGGLLPLKGRPVSTFLTPAALSVVRDTTPRETTACRADGSVVPILAAVSPLSNARGTAVCVRDLTPQKAVDARLRSLDSAITQSKQERIDLLESLSDDLRGPLNGIIGYTEMLQEEAEERAVPDLLPDIEKIKSGGRHLLSVANDLLNLSRIENGQVDLYLQTFSIPETMQGAATALRPLLDKGGNALDVHCPDDIGTMYADPTKLQQSLVYSVNSFCKYTAKRTISVDVARESGAQERIAFRVFDAGHGGAGEGMPSSSSAVQTAQRTDAAGLAVSISRRFCRMMGGDVEVATEPGRGRVLTIRVPAEVVLSKGQAKPLSTR